MAKIKFSLVFFFIAFCTISVLAGRASTSVQAISESKYSKAHSLGNDYNFDPRDGWQAINVTDLGYKYRQFQMESHLDNPAQDGVSSSAFENRSTKKKSIRKKHGLSEAISGVLKSVIQGLKGVGKPEPVTITW